MSDSTKLMIYRIVVGVLLIFIYVAETNKLGRLQVNVTYKNNNTLEADESEAKQ